MTIHRHPTGPLTWAAIIASTCMLLFVFQKILWLVVPFLLAFVLYYLLSPFTRRLVMAGMSPGLAAALLSGAFMLLAGGWLLVLYPLAIANVTAWQTAAARYLDGGSNAVQSVIAALQLKFVFLRNIDVNGAFHQNLFELTNHFSEKYLSRMLVSIAAWLPSLLLAPVITYFLLKDGGQLRKFIGSAVPNAYFEKTLYLMHALDHTAKIYFLGLFSLAAFDAAVLSGGLWLMGIPSPILLGVLAAGLSVIPYLGPLLGCAIAIMVTGTDLPGNPALIYGVIGLFALVRVLDDFVVMPYVMGKSMHIHPLLTLLMFFIGEAIAGVAGLMLVIPILGVMMVIGETLEVILSDTRLRARYVHGQQLRQREATRDLSLP